MPVITHDFRTAEKAHDADWPARPESAQCLYCGKHPSRVYNDHCAPRELREKGAVPLRYMNPAGVERFDGRPCITCDGNIMDHWILNGKSDWFCDRAGERVSGGMK